MPRLKIDYSNAVIYKIVCNDLNITDCYVGSTTNFVNRKNAHKVSCCDIDNKSYNLKLYKIMRDNGGWANWSMIEIEKYNCKDGNELRSRERYFYELLESKLNMKKPSVSIEEVKQYSKEYHKHYRVEYEKINKDKIKTNRHKIINCICGCEVIYRCINIHLKSNKHNKLMNKLLFQELSF